MTTKKFLDKIICVVRATIKYGGIAQLGEHLPCTQGVRSSNLLTSTICGSIAQVVRAHA